jgi:hypothetical protein
MSTKGWQATESWLGLLTGPTVFLINLQVNLTMVSWVCATGNAWTIHLAHAVSLAVVTWSGLLARRAYVRVGRGVPGEAGDAADRERFLAVAGMLIAAFSFLSLLAHWIPNFVLSPCQ